MSDFEKHISASDLIRWIKAECNPYGRPTLDYESGRRIIEHIKSMSPAQPEPKNKLISEIEGKTPEETYDFLVWLLNDYGMQFTDSRQAVIEWLRGE